MMPATDKRPNVVRKPYSPQKLAGTRTDPPVSVPSAKSQRPAATTEAEPLDDPPGTRVGAFGLIGVPKCGFIPNIPQATSSVWVLPIRCAPAISGARTAGAVATAGSASRSRSGLPQPDLKPATSMRSLAANESPASGPSSFNRREDGPCSTKPCRRMSSRRVMVVLLGCVGHVQPGAGQPIAVHELLDGALRAIPIEKPEGIAARDRGAPE